MYFQFNDCTHGVETQEKEVTSEKFRLEFLEFGSVNLSYGKYFCTYGGAP